MDANTGRIYSPEEMEAMGGDVEKLKSLFEITKTQADTMADMKPFQRKNHMRNQPCVCGSGKKFKKCCWNNYS